jgi:uncharacterized membrane protein YfcA
MGTFTGLLMIAVGGSLNSSYYGTTTNDVDVTTAILVLLALIVCYFLGIVGAISYNNGLLGVAVIAYCVKSFVDLLMGNIVGLILDALFIYPHASLINEIQSGIMSPTTYEREKQSCCCV